MLTRSSKLHLFAVKQHKSSTFEKFTTREEFNILTLLTTSGASRTTTLSTPKCEDSEATRRQLSQHVTITMPHLGINLLNCLNVRHILQQFSNVFLSDIRQALCECWNIGVRHLDLYARNIMFDGAHFYLVDFDKVEWTRDWTVDQLLNELITNLNRQLGTKLEPTN